MKKSVSLKLIVFSFLLVTTSISYSAPTIEAGTGANSTLETRIKLVDKKV